ncbi:MAG: flippase-like domain-containing protein [Chlorobi bacterium]|nr:flippase-like domain-containing protein [Chlorobiota bacterium]MBX7215669.1 flippase-like domain-containing protein [Candidatus Kapabacteria bacterium]
MNQPLPTPKPIPEGRALLRRPSLGRILQGVLAVAGIGMFAYLARNVSFAHVADAGTSLLVLALVLLILTAINYSLDTLSWWLVCGEKRPSFLSLTAIRLRCESLTNILPGGAVIGEPMKVMQLLRATTMTTAEATTSFLLAKFCIIIGQVLYVVIGVLFSYAVLSGRGEATFGTEHFGLLVLGAVGVILLLLLALLGAMVWFQPMLRYLVPTEREGRWGDLWNRLVAEAHSIEQLVAVAGRKQGGKLAAGVFCGFLSWSLNGVEAYLILHFLGVDSTFTQAFAIDAVSCVIRMVMFILPIGIGGQDWAITGLMTVHGIANPVGASAQLAVVKRAREFVVVGVGLAMLAFSRNARQTSATPPPSANPKSHSASGNQAAPSSPSSPNS